MRNVEKGIRVYTLPTEERALNNLLNDETVEITNRVITPCPKECIVLYLVEYEKLKE